MCALWQHDSWLNFVGRTRRSPARFSASGGTYCVRPAGAWTYGVQVPYTWILL